MLHIIHYFLKGLPFWKVKSLSMDFSFSTNDGGARRELAFLGTASVAGVRSVTGDLVNSLIHDLVLEQLQIYSLIQSTILKKSL